MKTEKLVQEIYREDCVGDSTGKHNFNLISLDTSICNLSSQYFIVNNNFYQVFTDFIQNAPKFIEAYNLFYNPFPYNVVTAAVNLLSSYWEKHEFSVHYPLNISILNDLALSCPTVNLLNEKLVSLAKIYINKEYPAKNYLKNTKLNVIFFLYNVPVNPKNPNDLVTSSFSPEFSFRVRHMLVEMFRQDVHLANGKIFEFINYKNEWKLVSITTGTQDITQQPSLIQVAPSRIYWNADETFTQGNTANSGRSSITVTTRGNIYNLNLFYQAARSGLYIKGYSDVTLVIESDCYIGSTSAEGPALLVDGFSTGDTVKIVNKGSIIGCGGAGGIGQSAATKLSVANDGQRGGDAISLKFFATIVNNGLISGGGGGGAGGLYTGKNIVGAGGGGGAGFAGGAGGAGGKSLPNVIKNVKKPNPDDPKTSFIYGNKGTDGSRTAAGKGGAGTDKKQTNKGADGGELGLSGASTGSEVRGKGKNKIVYVIPPLGGEAGYSIFGSSYIDSLTTDIKEKLPYGDLRGKFLPLSQTKPLSPTSL